MNYCPQCLGEYEGVSSCADCGVALVDAAAIAARPEFKRFRTGEDTTRFVRAGVAEDLFEADAFTSAIAELGIPILTRPHRETLTIDAITTSTARPWWELLVPEQERERAAQAVEARKAELASSQDEAERAAEEESGALA